MLRLSHVVSQAEMSLYTELEKLSTAWESLERQVKDKVFDLSNLENQLKKATSEVSLVSGISVTILIIKSLARKLNRKTNITPRCGTRMLFRQRPQDYREM